MVYRREKLLESVMGHTYICLSECVKFTLSPQFNTRLSVKGIFASSIFWEKDLHGQVSMQYKEVPSMKSRLNGDKAFCYLFQKVSHFNFKF